jgi:thiamine biosynthesis lipoprotein
MKRLLTRLLGCTLLLSCFVLLPGGCDTEGQKRYHAEFLTLFDTVTRIVGYADSEEAFTRLAEQIYDKLQEYHQLYDIYNDYEDVTNIKTLNDSAGQGPVKVDGRILSMLQFAKEQ